MKFLSIKHILATNLEKNADLNAKYFEYDYKVFYELESTVDEIGKCIILHLNYATITLTNHLLERLLKLALIHKSVGIGLKFLDELNAIFSLPSQKYGSFSLGKSIEQCVKEDLIEKDERDFLFSFIRETLRNGFSHGDASKILADLSNETNYYHADEQKKEWIEMAFNPKNIPQFQSAHIEAFANEYANLYFDYVFQLLQKIETRLIAFDRKASHQNG